MRYCGFAQKQLRKCLYESDETIKNTLPEKNTDDNLEHELDYTKDLLNVVGSNPCLAEVPKIKERLNMLKEVLSDIEDHYVTSEDEDARLGTRVRMPLSSDIRPISQ